MSGTTSFAIGSALLVIFSLGFLLWPFRRRSAKTDRSRQQLNAAIYRDQFADLESDRATGTLSQADYEQAKAELQRRLLEDSQASDPQAGKFAPSRVVPTAMAFILPLGAILLYLVLGNPAALNPATAAASPHTQQMSEQDIEKLVADFAAKLESEPENHQGWAMLARSYKSMGRFPEAIRAYERTGPMLETSADLLVDYADTLAAANGFDKKVMAAIERALKLDAKQPQALWLRGTAAFEAKQYAKAVTDWEALLALFPADSEEARVISGNLAEARQLGGLKPAATPAAKVGAGGTAPQSAAQGGSIMGRVELAPAMAGKLPAGGVLMVVARPNDGSRMPVAVVRADAAALPFDFVLDDSLAMSPDRKLSQFQELLVEARVSKTGQAVPQAGDLFGPAVPAKLGAKNIALKIDQVRP
ncbi:MAG: c-type cytochrome biogenesis protein CcmI [Pseudomonadota bacterium]